MTVIIITIVLIHNNDNSVSNTDTEILIDIVATIVSVIRIRYYCHANNKLW